MPQPIVQVTTGAPPVSRRRANRRFYVLLTLFHGGTCHHRFLALCCRAGVESAPSRAPDYPRAGADLRSVNEQEDQSSSRAKVQQCGRASGDALPPVSPSSRRTTPESGVAPCQSNTALTTRGDSLWRRAVAP